MAIGFPPRVRKSRTFGFLPGDLVTAARAAMDKLGWPYEAVSDTEFKALPPHSGWSWGEEVHVQVLPDGALQVESKGLSIRGWYDLGRNGRNIRRFFAALEQVLGVQPPS
jgi:hypothetical protein